MRSCDELVRQRLNERLFESIQKIELKRMKAEKEEARQKSKAERRKSEIQKQKDALNDIGRRGKGKGVRQFAYLKPNISKFTFLQ